MLHSQSRLRSDSAQPMPTTTTYQQQYYKNMHEVYMGPPIVTAHAWAIHDGKTGELLWSKQEEEKREMASLTKIMTCIVSCDLIKSFELNPNTTMITVPRIAAWIIGTHSGLKEGDQISIMDLLYGMMLPSGNDCAITLAYSFGMLIYNKKKRVTSTDEALNKNPIKEFVKKMNKTAHKYNLKNTSFGNPHGLSDKGNKSTAADLGKLATIAMNNITYFDIVVSTKTYAAKVIDSKGNIKTLHWINTNKLLEQQYYCGVKTGNTPTAGPCLCIGYKNEDCFIIITLLGCRTSEHRWIEASKLSNWFISQNRTSKSSLQSRSKTASFKIRPKVIIGLSKQYQSILK